ncbi:MAG TPA: VOC family protein [Fimbriimonadaceae bacterium]|jgi:predicted enzyme related to lactoylglutathione lyase
MYKLKQPIPSIPVKNMQAAQQFYAETFGWESPWEQGEYGGMSRDGMQIHFLLKTRVNPVFIYNLVDNVDEIYDHVVKLHVRVVSEVKDQAYGMREFTSLDPDGNFIVFAQPIALAS